MSDELTSGISTSIPRLASHVEILGLVVLAVLDRGQERCHVLDWVVCLEPRGLVRDVGITGGVRAVERVVGERLDQRPQALGLVLCQSRLDTTFDKNGLLGRHHLAVLLTDCFSNDVGSAGRVTRELLQHQDDLLLVHENPVSLLGDVLEGRIEIADLVGVVLALDVRGNLLHGAWPVQSDQSHDLLEAVGLELQDQPPHAVGFELEDAVGVPQSQHLVDLGVGEIQRVDVDVGAPVCLDVVLGELDDRKVPQSQEVHLEQAQLLDEAHVVLGHDLTVLAAFEWDVLDQRVRGR